MQKMKFKNIQIAILILLSVLLFSRCAKIVAPTGGPKDEEHPLIVEAEPPFNSVNFDSKTINITFNEFIQLKDLNSNLVVSPPLEEKPKATIKGKTLEIELLSELLDSTTYNLYFGNSVQDYNEGNPIENFEYVFSTGDFIDSLSIKGQVINSYNLLPEEGVFVMLYKDYEDSVPIKQLPVHISKTNKEGFFQINNISNNKFKLFCLRDLNKNYLFDLPNEDIAFMDSLVTFQLITETTIDTIYKSDTLAELNDSVFTEEPIKPKVVSETLTVTQETEQVDSSANYEEFSDTTTIRQSVIKDSLVLEDSLTYEKQKEIDTIIVKSKSYFPIHEFVFRLFTEYHEVQYLVNNTRNTRQRIDLVFNKPVKDSIQFSVLDTIINSDWFLKEVNSTNDSIIYWLTDSTLYNKEHISFALTYQQEDSNMVYQWTTDTLKLRYTEPELKKNEEPDTSLQYTMNIKSRTTIDLNRPINLLFETPLYSYDTSKINLFAIVDSVEIPVQYQLNQDSLNMRNYTMDVEWSSDTIYRIEIYPGAFKDIYSTVNDTNTFEFKSQKRDYYGKILANVTGIDSSATPLQAIIQVILPSKDKESILREETIKKDQIVEFDYLPPKEVMLKIILDKNFNGRWDTGEYLKHLQPEEVLYYKDKIEVRSNWDIEVNVDLNKE